jgi:drug/metabolite transporter (DMT)-like permease
MAWLLFNESLTAPMLAGMALTAVGVSLVVRREGKPEPSVT